jgi:predicted GIY-YIG superfamily endonuclease
MGSYAKKIGLTAYLGSRQSLAWLSFFMEKDKTIKHYWLYVLLLEGGKYYVGITSQQDPHDRIKQHFNGFYSAEWVKAYKPVKTLEVVDLGDVTKDVAEVAENTTTLSYMRGFGYQNVRGGRFTYSGRYIKLWRALIPESTWRLVWGLTVMTVAFALMTILAWH